MVEKVCPSLEASRAFRNERTKAAREVRKAKREALDPVLRDDLIEREFKRLAKLSGIKVLPKLKIRRSKVKSYSTGRCYSNRAGIATRIVATLGYEADWLEACELLAHELTHAANVGEGHSDVFRSCLVDLIHRAYGVTFTDNVPGHRYKLDTALLKAMRQQIPERSR